MQQKKNLFRLLLILSVGAVFAYAGISVPSKDIEQVVDAVTDDVIPTQENTSAPTIQPTLSAEIVSVIDGDTVVVLIDDAQEHVRILGIDTPETKHSSRGAECFGVEASAYAKTLLFAGETITLTPDPTQDTRDKYNRMIAYVTLPDGRDLGALMIQNGYAHEYTFKGRAYQKQALYKALQANAKKEMTGLWGLCLE